MSTRSRSVALPVHTPEDILANPRFAAARSAFIDAVLAFHEGDRFSSRLMVETMRQVTFNLIVSRHLRHDVTDRSTWPTPQRLKAEIKPFGLASPRRIDALVARLVQLGYVDSRPSDLDGRVRLLTPTPKMMALDREWLVYNYVPLHVMFPDGYAEPMARDPAFQRAQRLVALDFSAKGAEILAGNPPVMRFMHRDAGMLVLIKLVQMSAAGGADGVSYTDIGARFGVSRTHVRSLLEDAAQHGDVSLSGRSGRLVELKPPILQAFDRFLADAMSGHDLLYKLASERMRNG
ncbi:helix-turn-helix domain-containing protein [Bradyrhizobium sp. Pear77]|uniref:helix-turn-helix domain-containing protein n=1 Tax=Bradyrhizobium altum TaxID=1571202 RepID=UPI001E34FCC2|nr:helix-turn-helix domain-containing protein [Bradyrhizobium altum]MCC8953073.1 helix-turn-helix domain-containing protein [Bradyrhizobium altum]